MQNLKPKYKMKFITKLTLLLITVFLFNCSSEKEQVLQINGKVVGTDTKSIILLKLKQDIRFDSIIEIPVENGKFHFESKLQNPEVVMLFLGKAKEKGGRFMPLFLENEKIELTIYPEEEFDNNIIKGGKLNAEYKKLDLKFKNQLQPLQDSLNILGKKYKEINDKLNTELEKIKNKDEKIAVQNQTNDLNEQRLNLMTKGKLFEKKTETVYSEQKLFQQEYMKNNRTIVSYYFLLRDLISYTKSKEIFNKETIDINLAKNTFDILKKTYPNHPYNELASNIINAITNIKVGKKYLDFSAPDLSGKIVAFSNEIEGKITLLDLWATWCGPCIKKSRTMIPVYNEYKDKGFTIVGVAGEFKNTDRLTKFLEKEKWPWLQLVDLDRQNNIWNKYGIDNSGGAIYLIDEKGIILAKDPTADEVRKELETRLN